MANRNNFETLKYASKAIDVVIQVTKISGDVLKSALTELLTIDHHEKKGRITLNQLNGKNRGGKLDNIEITDNNIRDFLSVAKKYDIDFALKRDNSTQPPTYHVFFQTAKQENFQRAFSEYVGRKDKQISKAPMNTERLRREIQKAAEQPREDKTHHKEKIKEEIR